MLPKDFEPYLDDLYAYVAFRLGAGGDQALDLVQETLRAALATSSPPRDPAALRPWLYAIAPAS